MRCATPHLHLVPSSLLQKHCGQTGQKTGLLGILSLYWILIAVNVEGPQLYFQIGSVAQWSWWLSSIVTKWVKTIIVFQTRMETFTHHLSRYCWHPCIFVFFVARMTFLDSNRTWKWLIKPGRNVIPRNAMHKVIPSVTKLGSGVIYDFTPTVKHEKVALCLEHICTLQHTTTWCAGFMLMKKRLACALTH